MNTSHDGINHFESLFEDFGEWQVFASGQAEGRISSVMANNGQSILRLDYDFHGGGGFIAMRRAMAFSLPDTFEMNFQLRGAGPPNHFEVKVASPGGANVWRHLRQDFELSNNWSDFIFHERELPFAWGPAGGGGPTDVEALEIVIAAGPGGSGFIELTNAHLNDQTLHAPHAIHASSSQPGHPAIAAFKPAKSQVWRAADDDLRPCWSMDIGRPLRFGGLVIDWPDGLPPRSYAIDISVDGTKWLPLHRATRTLGAKSHIPAAGAVARYLKITFDSPHCAALRRITLRPDSFSSTPNEFIHSVAADFPRGWFPRYWHREQSYWTPVGSPEGKRRALVNEEGMVEVDEGGFSLEPFILTKKSLITWADVKTSVDLEKKQLPLPRVSWKKSGITLAILPWVDGTGDQLTLRVTYRLTVGKRAAGARLAIAVRPFQVNPPWQAFRNLGGRSPINQITHSGTDLLINERTVTATPSPACTGAALFEEGGIMQFLADGVLPTHDTITDASGLASAAMIWQIPDHQSTLEVTVSVPYYKQSAPLTSNGRKHAMASWNKTLGSVRWQVPASAKPAFDCFRTTAAHILINRDGPAIQPGPRRYTRSWVRDCVIMGAALAKAGLTAPLREFITWYATFQRDDGFIPCVVDRDGIDWLVEHDSHGQFLWGVREVMRRGGSRKFLRAMLPHVKKAARFLIETRQLNANPNIRTEAHTACYGLLPESASHEGYLAHPVHSYWDDFWGVRGLEAAADLAGLADLSNDATLWRNEAAAFQKDLIDSINKVIHDHQLNYIPGSVEWADFDPTATSNAIAMLDFANALPQPPLRAMLATYLDGFHRKHRGQMPWNNYTAYEIRIIGAFVRLGERAIANELLEFFLSDRRPLTWNQWPEITWKDSRSPGHLGDIPHTWIAAEYLLALASMVADERESSNSLVLASGMPWAWIADDQGFAVKNLPTRHGPLHFTIRAENDLTLHLTIADTLTEPPTTLTVTPPLPVGKSMSRITNSTGELTLNASGTSLMINQLPCSAVIQLA